MYTSASTKDKGELKRNCRYLNPHTQHRALVDGIVLLLFYFVTVTSSLLSPFFSSPPFLFFSPFQHRRYRTASCIFGHTPPFSAHALLPLHTHTHTRTHISRRTSPRPHLPPPCSHALAVRNHRSSYTRNRNLQNAQVGPREKACSRVCESAL